MTPTLWKICMNVFRSVAASYCRNLLEVHRARQDIDEMVDGVEPVEPEPKKKARAL